jgi:MoxR-like ATPase
MAVSEEVMVPNSTHVVHWEENPRNPQGVKSNKTSVGRTKKIMLVAPEYKGPMPRAGEPWVCVLERVKGKSEKNGSYQMRPVQPQAKREIKGVWLDPIKAELMCCVLQDPRRNLMMHGDQGVGKSTIADAVAESFGWRFEKISCGLIKKAVYMLGRYVPVAEGDSLNFKYQDSKLIEVLRAAASNPHVTFLVMFDEFTRMDEDARDTLLDIIEGKKRFIRLVTGEEIPVGKNLKFMAAGNVGEGFTVRREDAAQSDRWEIIKITCMPAKEELEHCLRLYPACPKNTMELAIKAIAKVRDARKDASQQISKTVSTRRAEATAMYLSRGIQLEVALEAAVANQFEGGVADPNSQAYKVLTILKDEVAKNK